METRRGVLAFIVAAAVVMTALSLGVKPAEEKARTRIGVYDNRAVAIAYIGSAAHEAQLKAYRDRHVAAVASGDEKTAATIRRAMDRMQWLTHRQGFGRASVDDAMALIRDKLPQVARETRVAAIVCNPDHLDAALVERVDVTDQVVALFDPGEKAMKSIESVRRVEPAEIGFDFDD